MRTFICAFHNNAEVDIPEPGIFQEFFSGHSRKPAYYPDLLKKKGYGFVYQTTNDPNSKFPSLLGFPARSKESRIAENFSNGGYCRSVVLFFLFFNRANHFALLLCCNSKTYNNHVLILPFV